MPTPPIRFRLASIALAGLLCLMLSVLVAGALPAAKAANVDPAVYEALQESADGQAVFILYLHNQADLSGADQIDDWSARGRYVVGQLQAAAQESQQRLQAMEDSGAVPGRVSEFEPFWIVNAIVVRGDRQALDALARQPEVNRVLPGLKLDPPPTPETPIGSQEADAVGWGVTKIGAPTVWAAPYEARGQGVVVGVIDTGVQWDHPALKTQYRGWNAATNTVNHDYNWFNPRPEMTCDDTTSGTCDWHGHGTHVTGIVAADNGGVAQYGVAPAARWIHALGCCPDNEALLATLQWMLAPTDRSGANPNPDLRPQVVNNSYGGPGGSLITEDAIGALVAAGIVPVFAAGNRGGACGTMDSPGDNPSAYSAGATDSSDRIASFSSRGPNPFTGEVGPDVSAPGSSIPSSLPGDKYGLMSGTSMAAPHVTGAVALILSAVPELIGKVGQIEELLRATATPLVSAETCGGTGGQSPNSTFGHGRIDVAAAVAMVWQPGVLSGTVTDAASGQPMAGAEVTITRDGRTLSQKTGTDGAYSFVAGAGAYTVQASHFDYTPPVEAVVSVNEGSNTTHNIVLDAAATATIGGVVREGGAGPDAGVAIPGAKVTVAGGPADLSAVTGGAGAYSLDGVPTGERELLVTVPGFENARAMLALEDDMEQDFSLSPVPDYETHDGDDHCSVPFSWIDIDDGTVLTMGDDDVKTVSLPAPFTFYGNTYPDVSVSSNGFISFGAAYARWQGIIPFEGPPNNAIYGLSDDLNPTAGSGKVLVKGLSDGRFVVTYRQVEHWPSGDPETFQIILDPKDNSIVLQYQEVSWPDFTSVGLENASGTRAVRYSYANEPPIYPGLAVKFLPFQGSASPCQRFSIWLPQIQR